ncbi:MAG TPA: ABC transporter permease [Candidatus Acidoferrales bacterium]
MKILAYARAASRALLNRVGLNRELDEEIRSHIAMHADDLERSGLSRAAAERQARIAFGGGERFKEECREVAGISFVESVAQDVRFALRLLRKNPALTAAVILTLALGIGVNVAMFSVFDSFLFRMLPVQNPSHLVTLSAIGKKGGESTVFSYPDFQDIKNQTTSIFSGMAAIAENTADGISVNGRAEPILTNYVDGNYFGVLGVRPALGRLILPTEGKALGANPVLVLGYSYWQAAFAGDPNVVGKRVAINGHVVTIVGVAQKGFQGTRSFLDVQGYLTLAMMAIDSPGQDSNFISDREAKRFEVVARLRRGLTISRARPVLDVAATRVSEQYPAANRWSRLQVAELGALGPIVGPNPIPIVAALFLTLAGLVLLLACLLEYR